MALEIIISKEAFEKFYKTGNLEDFYKDKAKAFEYEGEKYVYTGSVSGRLISARKAVLKENYKGDVEPMYCSDHTAAVLDGKRERGYYARLVNIDRIPHVLTDKVDFVNSFEKALDKICEETEIATKATAKNQYF